MLYMIQVINILFQVFTLMLFARIMGSWLPQLNEYRAMQVVATYTDPYLAFFRRFIPPVGMLDFSPIVAFLCLGFLQTGIINLLLMMA